MFAIILGQIAGLARSIIVARTFGASPELDAFFAANRVSETLFLLVAGGALGIYSDIHGTARQKRDGLRLETRILACKCGHSDLDPARRPIRHLRPDDCPLLGGTRIRG
jgi:hypothetical protein